MKTLLLLLMFFVNVSVTNASKLQAFTEDLPPYQLTLESGPLSGYSVELMQSLALMAEGKTLSVHLRNWATAYRTVIENKNTVLFSASRTKEREDLFIWGGVLLSENVFIWSLNPDVKASNVDALRNYSISLTRSSSSDYYFTHLKFPRIVQVDQQQQNMKMLYRHRVDLIIGTPKEIHLRAKKLGVDEALLRRIMLVPALSQKLYFTFNKDTDADLIQRYMSAYENIKQAGKIEQLRAKWL